jgi:hypothetical protein
MLGQIVNVFLSRIKLPLHIIHPPLARDPHPPDFRAQVGSETLVVYLGPGFRLGMRNPGLLLPPSHRGVDKAGQPAACQQRAEYQLRPCSGVHVPVFHPGSLV